MNPFLAAGLALFVLAAVLIGLGVVLAVSGDVNVPLVIAVFVTSAVLELTGLTLMLRGWLGGGRGDNSPRDATQWGAEIYADRLLRIYDEGLWFPWFYFPWGARFVPFAEIERIECRPPTLLNGRWRTWGSGDLVTWFPLDAGRSRRPVIFHLVPSGRRWRIGFTAEDSERVNEILRRRVRLEEVNGGR